MATDGDKIAAATLAAALVIRTGTQSDDVTNLVNTYGDILMRIARIDPATGTPATHEQTRRNRMRPGAAPKPD